MKPHKKLPARKDDRATEYNTANGKTYACVEKACTDVGVHCHTLRPYLISDNPPRFR